MALDGIVMGAIANDLNTKIKNRKIDRIYQVENRDIVIHMRRDKLLISASAHNPCIYMTEENFKNPQTPPLFSMVLRKHLSGGIIKSISQFGSDRVLKIDIQAWDDFSEIVHKSLIVEIMGRYSNIILTEEDLTIIDAITRVSPEMSRVRSVLPGLEYKYLEDDTKVNLRSTTKEQLVEIFTDIDSNRSTENIIFATLEGFSKQLGTEMAVRAGLHPDSPFSDNTDKIDPLVDILMDFKDQIISDKYYPTVYLDNGEVVDFHITEMESLAEYDKKKYDSVSEMLDNIYTVVARDNSIEQASGELRRNVRKILDRDVNKLSNQERELTEAEDREKYRIWADLLSANFHLVEPGDESIEVVNFYSEDGETMEIPIDPKHTPPINAQRYYKRYQSLKNREKFLDKEIDKTKAEIDYLSSVISSIDLAQSLEELEEIKNELILENYIKRNRRTKKRAEDLKSQPISIEKYGYEFLIGRNNRQNEQLTFKTANRYDWWLHAKDIPGSHVIIRNKGEDLPAEVLEFGARLAAYYSSSRDSGTIDVDYTQILNVRRHPARRPGLVNYVDFETIHVDSSDPN